MTSIEYILDAECKTFFLTLSDKSSQEDLYHIVRATTLLLV